VNLTDKPVGEGHDKLPPKSVRIVENRVVIGVKIAAGTPKSKASKSDVAAARRGCGGAEGGA
jgi:hypothetical protein